MYDIRGRFSILLHMLSGICAHNRWEILHWYDICYGCYYKRVVVRPIIDLTTAETALPCFIFQETIHRIMKELKDEKVVPDEQNF